LIFEVAKFVKSKPIKQVADQLRPKYFGVIFDDIGLGADQLAAKLDLTIQ
jgi:hypothetical protein